MEGSLGKHILAEFSGCSAGLMNDVNLIENAMITAAEKAGATVINSTFHHFSPFGVSGIVVIQESHLAIHTWPEFGYASVDIFTCGDTTNPWVCCQHLKSQFQANDLSAIEMKRGSLELLAPVDTADLNKRTVAQNSTKPQHFRDVWFTDKDDDQALSIRHSGEVLFREQTPFQTVQVFKSARYGRMLTLDNMIMTTEADHFQYHEMIAHPAIFAHGNVKNVLIVGGGDGGTLGEVLKHPSIEEVVMVEIDEAVVRASQQTLHIADDAFANDKAKIIIADAIQFVEQHADDSFDLILVDGSEPVGPAEGLFTADFFRNCHRCLRSSGIVVTQGESPRFNEAAFQRLNQSLRQSFPPENVWVSLFFVPTYPSGMWSFQWGTKKENANSIAGKEPEIDAFCRQHNLRYYNASIHTASFALPTFVKDLLSR